MMRWQFNPQDLDGWDHHLGTAGIVGFVLMIVLWAAVIAALVLGIRALVLHSRRNSVSTVVPVGSPTTGAVTPPPGEPGTIVTPTETGQMPAAQTPSLLAILEERYARGETDRDEFLQRKQDLGLS